MSRLFNVISEKLPTKSFRLGKFISYYYDFKFVCIWDC